MSQETMAAVKALVQADPHSGPALTLFALIKTLSSHNHQYLFLLNKLRDLNEEQRQLAYALMEMMVAADNETEQWNQSVLEIEALIREG